LRETEREREREREREEIILKKVKAEKLESAAGRTLIQFVVRANDACFFRLAVRETEREGEREREREREKGRRRRQEMYA